MSARVLVMAKAPVPGLAKTRLGATTGAEVAADLAAAALLDTLDACTAAFEVRFLALAGDLADASRGEEIRAALDGWTVFEQSGDAFDRRLVHAHAEVAARGTGAVVQVGMDTPQLTADLLRTVTARLTGGAPTVLGPAEDGGWWVLGLDDGRRASALAGVPMSDPGTFAATARALTGDGSDLAVVETLRDVDTVEDAVAVAALAPESRFARSWNTLAVLR